MLHQDVENLRYWAETDIKLLEVSHVIYWEIPVKELPKQECCGEWCPAFCNRLGVKFFAGWVHTPDYFKKLEDEGAWDEAERCIAQQFAPSKTSK